MLNNSVSVSLTLTHDSVWGFVAHKTNFISGHQDFLPRLRRFPETWRSGRRRFAVFTCKFFNLIFFDLCLFSFIFINVDVTAPRGRCRLVTVDWWTVGASVQWFRAWRGGQFIGLSFNSTTKQKEVRKEASDLPSYFRGCPDIYTSCTMSKLCL